MRALLIAVLATLLLAPAAHAALEPPIGKTPLNPRGTVILLPGSGWTDPSLAAQRRVWSNAAPALFAAGYRVVAVDYEPGARAGLRSIRQAVLTERRRAIGGPLCLYGESSGGHLALLLANRMRAIHCVIGVGAPTSFSAFAAAADAYPSRPGYAHSLETAILPAFGEDPAEWAAWEPATSPTPVRVPVLLMICADDPIVPVDQIDYLAGAEKYVPPRGDIGDPDDLFVHGSVSAAGRREVRRRMVAFVDRAAAALSGRRSSRAGPARRRP